MQSSFRRHSNKATKSHSYYIVSVNGSYNLVRSSIFLELKLLQMEFQADVMQFPHFPP